MKESKKIVIPEDFKIGADTHVFNVSLATQIGLIESIILQHFFFMYSANKEKDSMIKEGRVWFFRSVKSMNETYPYISTDKIRRAIENLVSVGLVYKGDYSTDKFKRSTWYSLSDLSISIFTGKNANTIWENPKRFGKTTNDLVKSQQDNNIIDNNIIDNNIIDNIYIVPTTKKERFVKPTLEEVEAYIAEKGYCVNAQQFIDYYTSNGWKVGRNPMKDWKAAVRTWETKERRQYGKNKRFDKSTEQEHTAKFAQYFAAKLAAGNTGTIRDGGEDTLPF